ncbi:hypothetical protein ACIQLJ_08520 [Microbacterium sp. NPDC091313]
MRTRIPIQRPFRSHGGEWPGVAHGLPEASATRGGESMPLYSWQEAVRVVDQDSGVAYDVVPVRSDTGVIDLRHYSETGIHGALPESAKHPLPRLYLAMLAQQLLESDVDGQFGKTVTIAPPREPAPRPEPARLVAVVADLFSVYGRMILPEDRKRYSPRAVLSERYGIEKRTADEWIRRARAIAPDRIPAATTGRPRKDQS